MNWIIALILSILVVVFTPLATNAQTPPPGAEKMADVYFKASDYAKALPLYNLLLREPNLDDSERARIYFHIGQCQTAAHSYSDAVKTFEDVAARYGQTEWAAKALLRKGAVELGLLNKPKEGMATWQLLITRYSKKEIAAEAYYYRFAYLLVTKQKAQAKEILRTLQSDYSTSPFTAKAQSYLETK